MYLNISVNNSSYFFAGTFYLPTYYPSERIFYLLIQTVLRGLSYLLKEQVTSYITVYSALSYVLFCIWNNYLESDCIKTFDKDSVESL